MSKPRFHHGHGKARGNLRTEVTTAFGVDEVRKAVDKINARTQAFNYYHAEDVRYAKQRAKITLPLAISEWLNKEV